jgi:hypothetical protein
MQHRYIILNLLDTKCPYEYPNEYPYVSLPRRFILVLRVPALGCFAFGGAEGVLTDACAAAERKVGEAK